MKAFRFEPALFEHRDAALQALSRGGYQWFVDFESIDVVHETYGIEICGIASEAKARQMLAIISRLFPAWRFAFLDNDEFEESDQNWMVCLQRDPADNKPEKWG